MQASTTSSTIIERNKQILDKFIQSFKSEVTQVNSIDYINAYMRHCRLYEEQGEEMVLDGEGGEKNRKKQKKLVYRYDWLLDEARIGDDDAVQTLQDKIIHFVIYKKMMCLGANGIDNYISPLLQFKF